MVKVPIQSSMARFDPPPAIPPHVTVTAHKIPGGAAADDGDILFTLQRAASRVERLIGELEISDDPDYRRSRVRLAVGVVGSLARNAEEMQRKLDADVSTKSRAG